MIAWLLHIPKRACSFIMDRFSASRKHFGLTVGLGKTDPLYKAAPVQSSTSTIKIDDTDIKSVDIFCYLGSTICSNGSLDAEVILHIAKASAAVIRLNNRLWKDN